MSCLPSSGGCERWATDPFVARLNDTEGSAYAFSDLLDIRHRQTPQPEALYIDRVAGKRLVIERKCIVWPRKYAQHHENDHQLAELLFARFGSELNDRLYTLQLPSLAEISRKQLEIVAQSISREVLAAVPLLEDQIVSGNASGVSWIFHARWPEESVSGEPVTGVIVTWKETRLFDDFINAEKLPASLTATLMRVYRACARKFSSYPDTRRVLLIDPQGKLRFYTADWWRKVLHCHPPPEQVPEIWMGQLDYVDDEDRDWMFDRIL